MTAWRAFAGAATVGQGRSREAVARLAPALTDWRAGPARFAASGLARYLGKVLADGARIVEILDVLTIRMARPFLRGLKSSNQSNHMHPADGRAFTLPSSSSVQTPALRCDISLLRNRAPHLSGPAIPPHADCSPPHRPTVAELSCARCKQCARSAMRMIFGRHYVSRRWHDLPIWRCRFRFRFSFKAEV
jgi:hypothetical protein